MIRKRERESEYEINRERVYGKKKKAFFRYSNISDLRLKNEEFSQNICR